MITTTLHQHPYSLLSSGWSSPFSVSHRQMGHPHALSPWLSGLIRFLSHSTCWALLADDLRWPGFKSRSGREFSVGCTNNRYAIRLISRTGIDCVLFKLWQVPPLKFQPYGRIEMCILLLLLLWLKPHLIDVYPQVTWLVVTEVWSKSFGLVTEHRHHNERHIFYCQVWYHALSLHYACIQSSGIILIP